MIVFFVPFELTVINFVPVVLNEDKIPKLGFTFKQGDETKDVEKDALIEVLSTGERRAFYILNIIFEIEVRKKAGQQTLLVVDDVADSFDYKNKYAIIQYLKEITENDNFRQIILTHNLDFFRTIQSRFAIINHASWLQERKTVSRSIELSGSRISLSMIGRTNLVMNHESELHPYRS